MKRSWQRGAVIALLTLSLVACTMPSTTPTTTSETKKENVTPPVNTNEVKPAETKKDTTTETAAFAVGARVASKWADGNYWAATVTAIEGTTYTINYDDGTIETNTEENLIPLSDSMTLAEGDKVLAVWSASGRFYDGVVTEVKTGSALIKWDDGSEPSEVVFGKIIKQ